MEAHRRANKENSKRASFLPIFLATLRSRHGGVQTKLPLVADKDEKVAANVPPARCFLQLRRRGIPRGMKCQPLLPALPLVVAVAVM